MGDRKSDMSYETQRGSKNFHPPSPVKTRRFQTTFIALGTLLLFGAVTDMFLLIRREVLLTEVHPLQHLSVDNKKIVLCETNHVHIFDLNGKKIASFKTAGKDYIEAVSGRDNTVWVADKGNRRLLHYDMDGNLIREIKDNRLVLDFHLRVSPRDELWVMNTTGHEIRRYSSAGEFLGLFPGKKKPPRLLRKYLRNRGIGPQEYAHFYPRDVAWGSHGEIFVAEHSWKLVTVWNDTGEFLRAFPLRAEINGKEDCWPHDFGGLPSTTVGGKKTCGDAAGRVRGGNDNIPFRFHRGQHPCGTAWLSEYAGEFGR
ncbi:MAG: hypothetical protein D6679_01870 [Candidatus Hydrogenedentota bacterium]|nr:MAG: hypothetical protein D6679_01870 [Candidatus Hydrogenedentota bacterium]